MADEKTDSRFRSKNFKLGFIFLIVTIGVFLVAFASPYWSQTWVSVPWDFKNMGLWEICLENYIHRSDKFATIYNGCYWSFSRAMDNVRVHWNPRKWSISMKREQAAVTDLGKGVAGYAFGQSRLASRALVFCRTFIFFLTFADRNNVTWFFMLVFVRFCNAHVN